MDEARALLDELMGVSRDGERQEVKRSFNDAEVCKFYIQGFCFMEEFQRTKHNYGDCNKAHDDDCKQQWEGLDDAEKQKYPYERELYEWLEKLMSDLRSKVKRNEERISQISDPPLMGPDQTKLTEMEQQLKELQKRSVELAEQGDVDEAHAATTQADTLEAEAKAFQSEAKQRAQDNLNRYGEQEVCKYSGVIINSEESRLRDHKSGKNYRAWVRAHEKKQELDNLFKQRGSAPPSHSRSERADWHQDRGQERDGHRHRERERDTSHRDYSRSSRDRHRHRSRSRTRGSGYYDRGSREREHERRPR